MRISYCNTTFVSFFAVLLSSLLFFSLNGLSDLKKKRAHRHVFIDVGGNVGDSIAAFLSVGVPGVARAGSAFDAIYVFEPNPEFAPRYQRYNGKRYAFEFISAAATARDGFTTFGGSGLGGAVKTLVSGETGSTRTIDFSAWLQRTVSAEDFVVCKIDAEGSEFEIVQRMVADGTLCLCDRLSIEWHSWLGTRSPPNSHFRAFLDPTTTIERFDEGCEGEEAACFCSIPHLELKLPFFYCGLPYTTKWLRQACSLEGAPPLEHHEAWKGWEHVGQPDAFSHYTTE